jgi:hypothetical protein
LKIKIKYIISVILFLSNAKLLAQGYFYRTISSGNWNSALIWEKADDAGFSINVQPVILPPDDSANKITISPETRILIEDDVSADEVVISKGGTLVISGRSNLHLKNGAGIDLYVEGTLEDKANQFGGIKFATGATWALDAEGTFIKNHISSSTVLRDNYHGGMSTIPSTANWILRRETANHTPRFSTIDTYYPNLIIENMVDDHYDPGSPTNRFTGTSRNATIKGNLIIGGSGRGTITLCNENRNARPLEVRGKLIINSNCIFTNHGSDSGTGISIEGEIHNEGKIDYSSGTGFVSINKNSSKLTGPGKLLATKVEVNVPLLENENIITVTKEFQLIQGILSQTEKAKIILESMATLVGETDTHYIEGAVEANRYVNNTFIDFGNIGVEIDARKNADNLGNVKIKRMTGYQQDLINSTSIRRKWVIDPEFINNNPIMIKFSWARRDEIIPGQSLHLWKKEFGEDVWRPAMEAYDLQDLSISFETIFVSKNESNQLLSSNSFSTSFTLGELIEPLPVKWLFFNAKDRKSHIELTWATASEKDNKGFEVQRMKEGSEKWEKISFIKGYGNSSITRKYAFSDYPFPGQYFYKLKQIDFDGNYEYSNPIFIKKRVTEESNRFIIYPNPSNGAFNITFKGSITGREIISSKITGIDGKEIINSKGIINELEKFLSEKVAKLKPGTYILTVDYEEQQEQHKLVIIKD